MSKQYFVKRGESVRGPFNGQQIKTALGSRKLRKADMVSLTAEGPWRSIGELSGASAGAPAKKNSTLPTVKEFEMVKTLLGKTVARYHCPFCEAELRSSEKELAGTEECPKCFHQFLVSADALSEIQSERQRVEEEREDVRQERQVEKEKQRTEKERQKQIAVQQQLKVQQARKKEQLQKEEEEVLLFDEDGEEEAGDGVSVKDVADAVDLVQDLFSLFE